MIRRLVSLNNRAIPLTDSELDDAVEVEPGVYSVLREGRSLEVRILQAGAGYVVEVAGHRFEAEVRDPRNVSHRHATALGSGQEKIASPMPGKVVRVLVSEGQEIEPGEGLVVVEAMKMQNELKASKGGRVAKVSVQDGATVGAGEVLMVLE